MFISLPALRLGFLLIVATAAAKAEVAEPIVADFRSVSGYVVERQGQDYILDLDASDGIAVGDLVTVAGPGKRLTHPVTGEELGTLDTTKGVLRITRIAPKFSWAEPLEQRKAQGADIKRGDRVRRYAGIDSVFLDHTGEGEPLYRQLRNALPQLQWQGYSKAPANAAQPLLSADGLVFELTQKGLAVRDAESQLIKFYPRTTLRQAKAAAPAEASPPAAVVPSAVTPAPEAATITPARAPLSQPEQQVTYEAEYPQLNQLSQVSEAVVIADFISTGGRLLLATTDGQAIQVYDAAADWQRLAHVKPALRGKILALHWWYPEPQAAPLLTTTTWDGRRVRSAIYELQGSQLVQVRGAIPYILGTFDRDGDKRPETLLGQGFEPRTFFGRKVRQLRWVDGNLEARRPDFELPRRFTVQSAVFADLTGDGQQELAFIRDHILYVHGPDNTLLYQSPSQIGGSIAAVNYEVEPELEFSPVNTVPFELPPVAVDLDGDARAELITVASERMGLSVPGIGPGVKKSWLAVVDFRAGDFVKGVLGPELELPMQGLAVADDRVVFLTPESHSFFGGQSSESTLWSLNLQ